MTVDQSVEYQQNLSGSALAIVVLVAPSNDIEDLRPLMPRLDEALQIVRPGQVLRVGL